MFGYHMITAGYRYELRGPRLFHAVLAAVLKRHVPLVLFCKTDKKTFSIPPIAEAQFDLATDTFLYCEQRKLWPGREKVEILMRASAFADIAGQALKDCLEGDPTSLDELATLSVDDLRSRIDQRLAALSKVS